MGGLDGQVDGRLAVLAPADDPRRGAVAPRLARVADAEGGVLPVRRVEGVEALHARLTPAVPVVMPLVTQFYGAKEFAIADPDGYVITFAERVAADPASA